MSNSKEIKCPNCKSVFTIDDAPFADIVKQVRDHEFSDELHKRLVEAEKRLELEAQISAKEIEAKAEAERVALIQENTRLNSELTSAATAAELDKTKALADLITQNTQLEADMKVLAAAKAAQEATLRQEHLNELSVKDKEIELYKNMKVRQSTKAIGEDLEKHCADEFNSVRAMAFPNAYFEKDTNAKSGSQGDYIFRDYVDEIQIVSVMLEMKNEADATDKKKKNEDFFKELDKDRNEKGCEYAILVSMLEKDSDYYNQGIVDVSHKYPKMFVIRPQFFLPMLALLRNNALNTVDDKRELQRIRQQNIDVELFNDRLEKFKKDIGKSAKWANDRYKDAIDDIDKSIDMLTDLKDQLRLWVQHAESAETKANAVTIESLTKDNDTMTKKFKELGD
ncbi:MAG: DUF2130 domain-containing protein [Actinobacteria bacterium]|uniref:Unannotated protein n=1 Tax=freshwater metagenome TaxID=449393 RepID=A0A6J6N314_9ZZZZ|nr:DUF2130 domain-containing protein [Actinomycetota bacterium]